MADPTMDVLLNREVVEFRPKDDGSGKLGAVVLENRETGDTEELHPAGAFVFIGLDPNTGFVKGSVDLDDRGLIVTDMGSDEHAGRVRRGRRAFGLDQAAGVGGRRGRRGRDRDPDVPRGASRTRHVPRREPRSDGATGDLRAHHQGGREAEVRPRGQRGLRRQQARALLVQAREAATEIGNDALVQQADTRSPISRPTGG